MKLLIVGLGSIGQRHARCLRDIAGDDLQLIAFRQRGLNLEITDKLQARQEVSLEQRYGIRSFYSLEDALNEEPVAALVCTPNHLHLPIATQLAQAGLDLFLEKPISHSLDGVDTLQRILQQQGRICCVGYHLRFHPGIQQLVARVHDGQLGDVFNAHFDFGEHMPYWHRYEDYSQTFMAKESQGGGVTLTQIHDIDIVYALFGTPATVYASGGQTGTLKMDAEDHVASVLTYPQLNQSLTVSLTHDCLRYPPRRSYAIHGTRGSLNFDAYANRLLWTPFDATGQVVYEDQSLSRNALFQQQMQHFLDCIRRTTPPRVTLEDGANSLSMALAIKESLKLQQVIQCTNRGVSSDTGTRRLQGNPAEESVAHRRQTGLGLLDRAGPAQPARRPDCCLDR